MDVPDSGSGGDLKKTCTDDGRTSDEDRVHLLTSGENIKHNLRNLHWYQ